jgi:hypothetical protein
MTSSSWPNCLGSDWEEFPKSRLALTRQARAARLFPMKIEKPRLATKLLTLRPTGGVQVQKALIQIALVLAVTQVPCWATLHGYCAGVGQCVDNGTNSPTDLNGPLNFGFTSSPGGETGSTFLIDILEPSNETHDASVAITGTYSGTAGLVSSTAWTGGSLDGYLGISASPANPIGAYNGTSDTADPTVAGFFVYQLSITGPVTLNGPSDPGVNPLENIPAGIPLGSYIVAFLNTGTSNSPSWDATANSGAILETSRDGVVPAVPEPSSIVLFSTVALGLAILLKRKVGGRV